MKSTYGHNFTMEIFGASHAPEIGILIEGFPAGETVDLQELQAFLNRRAPGRDDASSRRREPDVPIFLSGLSDGKTDGGILKAVIRNRDAKSEDYEELSDTPRPGHADFTARMRYGEGIDMRGGGAFSGRMTAPFCIAGGVALQMLARKGIRIRAKVLSVGGISADEAAMRSAVAAAKAEGDSLGGIVECVAQGVAAGIGGHLFDGLESRIAEAVYAIPAVKGVEFGAGFSVASKKGSENNDAFELRNGAVVTRTNHCGGILGGISTGGDIVFRAAFKPTPSIAKTQETVNLRTMENVTISVRGRHDACIAFRALPVVEAAAALAILDALLQKERDAQKQEETQTKRRTESQTQTQQRQGGADLTQMRRRIDDIDERMLHLFEERMELAEAIAAYKKENAMPVFDAAREAEVFDKVRRALPAHLQEDGVSLFSRLMELSKAHQEKAMREDEPC